MKNLVLKNISVRFGKVQALSEVTCSLQAGERLMLVGPNGAGKSTLIRVLLGLVRPEQGQLVIDDAPGRADLGFRKNLGYLPEAVAFSDNLSGRQVLNFFARARGVPRKRIDEVLERVGLSHAASRRVRGYSRGMRQRLGLGAAILTKPQLLILDEPTGGLDQEGLSVLWSIFDEWHQAGRMVLASTHDLALMERRVDRMCVLREGRMLAADAPEALRRSVQLPHRVTMTVNPRANGQVEELVTAIREANLGELERDATELHARVVADNLLPLMDVRSKFPDAVAGLRVEEPSLDLVYEHLLESEP